VDRQGESRCLGANEEEASGNPSGLAATILRAAFRSRIYVSNREAYPALTKVLQKGGVHIRPHMALSRLNAGLKNKSVNGIKPDIFAKKTTYFMYLYCGNIKAGHSQSKNARNWNEKD